MYVSLLPDGTLKRKLVHLKLRGRKLEDALHDYPVTPDSPLSVFDKVETRLPDSTVEQEIIEFSELNFGPYVQVINYITTMSNYILTDFNKRHVFDQDTFENMMETLSDFVYTFECDNPLQGTLTRAVLDDTIPVNNGTLEHLLEATHAVVPPLQQIVLFQNLTVQLLSDLHRGVALDFKKKYRPLRKTEFVQTMLMNKDGHLTNRYHFRSPTSYYCFLLLNFIERKPTVELCRCCGRFFVPKTKRKTLYCDRVIRDGKTCKDLGPRLKHKYDAGRDKVIEEFDRARQRMYKRYERTETINQTVTAKSLTEEGLYEWTRKATEARDQYLAGELSEEEALKIITAT